MLTIKRRRERTERTATAVFTTTEGAMMAAMMAVRSREGSQRETHEKAETEEREREVRV
jgi:hypothetical protein